MTIRIVTIIIRIGVTECFKQTVENTGFKTIGVVLNKNLYHRFKRDLTFRIFTTINLKKHTFTQRTR